MFKGLDPFGCPILGRLGTFCELHASKTATHEKHRQQQKIASKGDAKHEAQ
jgi:hypothetical protein